MDAREHDFRKMLADMAPLFWDTEPESLSMESHAPYMIARLLNMGGMRGYLWVVDLFSEAQIVDALRRRRDVRPVVRSFMARKYDLPREALPRLARWR